VTVVTVSVSTSGLTGLLRAPGGPGAAYVRRNTERTANLSRVYARPHGTMASRIRTSYPDPTTGVVRCEHPAALYVVLPTRPHEIRPKRARALRFVPTGGRGFVFAKKVNHPGYRGDPFLQQALHDVFA
jgi:hypothetical protein